MMIKKSLSKLSCVIATALVVSAPVASAEDSPHVISSTVTFTTDYMFRGVSQTDRLPAAQGSIDYTYTPYGFYAGVWGSNVDDAFVSDGNIEIDVYGGFRGAFSNGIGWDIGGLYYAYPGESYDPGPDYAEVKGGLSYTFSDVQFSPAVSATLYYSPDYTYETGDSIYVDGALGLTLPYDMSLGFHIGYLDVDVPGSVYDWKVGLSKSFAGMVFNVSYYDVGGDDEGNYCFPPLSYDGECEGSVVFSVSRTF